VKDKSDGRAH